MPIIFDEVAAHCNSRVSARPHVKRGSVIATRKCVRIQRRVLCFALIQLVKVQQMPIVQTSSVAPMVIKLAKEIFKIF